MNTWGISGPAFLALYGTALVVVTAAALWVGRRRERVAADTAGLDEYEVALLNGGERLAAVVALVNLDRQGSLELGDRLLRELGEAGEVDLDHLSAADLDHIGVSMDVTVRAPIGPHVHPVEAAVYRAARRAKPPAPGPVVDLAAESSALADLRAGLVGRGLLYGPEDLDRLRSRWEWLIPLLTIGVVRLGYGLNRERPVLFLVLALAVTGGAMFLVSRRRPERTPAGRPSAPRPAPQPGGAPGPDDDRDRRLPRHGPGRGWHRRPVGERPGPGDGGRPRRSHVRRPPVVGR